MSNNGNGEHENAPLSSEEVKQNIGKTVGAVHTTKEGAKAAFKTGKKAFGFGKKVVKGGTKAIKTAFLRGLQVLKKFLIIAIVSILLLVVLYEGFIEHGTGHDNTKYTDNSIYNGGKTAQEAAGSNSFFSGIQDREDETEEVVDDYIEDYDGMAMNEKAVNKYLEILRKAHSAAYKRAMDQISGICKENNWDEEETIKHLDATAFDNVNYAEMICVLNCSEKFNSDSSTWADLRNFFKPNKRNKNLDYLFQIYYEAPEEDETAEETESDSTDESEETSSGEYGLITLYPSDLKSLYEMAGVDANAPNIYVDTLSNRDMLDACEPILRNAAECDYGSEARSVWDFGLGPHEYQESYDNYQNYVATFRDGEYVNTELHIDTAGMTNIQSQVVTLAAAKVGASYSQDYSLRRSGNDYFDCSSFAYWIYHEKLGISISGGAWATSYLECKYLEDNGKMVCSSYQPNVMQPGDIIFYGNSTDAKYKNAYKKVHHVAIYVGNGMQIDARGKDYGVVYREISSKSAKDIVSVCRPTM